MDLGLKLDMDTQATQPYFSVAQKLLQQDGGAAHLLLSILQAADDSGGD